MKIDGQNLYKCWMEVTYGLCPTPDPENQKAIVITAIQLLCSYVATFYKGGDLPWAIELASKITQLINESIENEQRTNREGSGTQFSTIIGRANERN